MPRARVYRDEALVLRRADFGEADRLVTLLTRLHGKIRGIARGARRPTSKHGGNLEPFVHVEVLLARGRDLEFISQTELRHAHRRIREDLQAASYAYYLVEVADAMLEPGDPAQPTFDLLLATLGALDAGAPPRLLAAHYLLKLLDLLGFRPELFNCLDCGTPLRPTVNFVDLGQGGVLCPECGPAYPTARPIDLDTLKVMRNLLRSDRLGDLGVPIPLPLAEAVDRQVRAFVEHHLDRRLRTPEFIARLRELVERTTEPVP
jgi:DNA repair protein RecO (recombination protein O)